MPEDFIVHYRITGKLGQGGMGEVYLAEDTKLDRKIALKLLPADIANDPSRRQRFHAEAKAASALNHPNVCTIYEVGQTDEQQPFIAMEHIEGQTLDQQSALDPRAITKIGIQVADALDAAHSLGIVHRDIKPSNITVNDRGQVKVLDFGLAKRLTSETTDADATTEYQTQEGRVLGTPSFMSPEQALGKNVDHRTDIFSLGVVLYHLTTGRLPFQGANHLEITNKIINAHPEPVARFNYEASPEIERIILTCLEKEAGDRYQSAKELLHDLRNLLRSFEGREAGTSQLGTGEVVTLLYVDIADVSALKSSLGVEGATKQIKQFRDSINACLTDFSKASEIDSAGDSVLLSFPKPSEAVQFATTLQSKPGSQALCRIGIHLGETVNSAATSAQERYSQHITICARLMQLAGAGRILTSRAVFDSARQVLKISSVSWANHGTYVLNGIDDPVEVCEVASGERLLEPPSNNEAGQRKVTADEELVLGWRPAVGQAVPKTEWVLERNLGEGGFGEVWLGTHKKLKKKRVFKFCFRADRVRNLKREVTLFRLLTEKVGEHPNIASIHEIYFDEAPYYVIMDYVEGSDLKRWCEQQGGVGAVPLEDRFEIVAQTAHALQRAHDCGIVHRDVKPGNILVNRINGVIEVKLTDFGIGQVLSEELLAGITGAGFTMTLIGSTGSQSGTQMYMAPELLAGGTAVPQSDIYSLGVVLYQLLIADTTKPLTVDWTTKVTDGLIRRDLERCFVGEPAERFTSAAEMAESLRRLEERREERARQQAETEERERAAYRRGIMRMAAAAALIIAVFAILVVYAFQQSEKGRQEAQRAEGFLAQLQIQRAEDFFAQKQPSMAIAYLCRVLRDNPSNRFVAQRLASALVRHNFVLPLVEPMRHQSGIGSARFSPDGNWVVTAASDWTVRVWDAHTGEPRTAPMRHNGYAVSAHFSPDGGWVVTASHDKTAQVWDAETGEPLSAPMKHESRVQSAVFSPNGQHVLTASGKAIRLWDARTSEEVIEPMHHEANVSTAYFSPDGQQIVSAFGEFARIWDAQTGKSVGKPMTHDGRVKSARFSPNGKWIVTASDDATARIWEATTGLPVGEPLRHDRGLNTAVFSPDSQRVLTTSFDWTARVWDTRTGQPIGQPMMHDDNVLYASFSPEGQRVVTTGWNRTAQIWDAQTGMPLGAPMMHEHIVWMATFSPDGLRILTTSVDGTAQIWNALPGRALNQVLPHDDTVFAADFSPDGRRLVTASDEMLKIWDAHTGEMQSTPISVGNGVRHASFSPDGKWVLTASRNHTAQVWDWQTGQSVGQPMQHRGPVVSAAFSPGGQWVVTASDDKTAQVWDASTGEPIGASLKHNASVSFAEFSLDGKWVATSSGDHTARVWEAETGHPVTDPMRHEDIVFNASISADQNWVVTSSWASIARLWNARTGAPLDHSLQHERRIRSAQFSPVDQWVATASWDKTARAWDAMTGKALSAPMKHEHAVRYVDWSPDGQEVVTHDNETVRLWDARSGVALIEPMRHEGQAMFAKFSHDGKRLVTPSTNAAQIWEVPSAPLPIPNWFAELGEALARRRLNENQVIEAVRGEKLITLKKKISQSTATDFYTKLGKWFFSDRSERTISPFSTVTVAEYIQQRLREDTIESLQEVLMLSPTDGVARAQLGQKIQEQKTIDAATGEPGL